MWCLGATLRCYTVGPLGDTRHDLGARAGRVRRAASGASQGAPRGVCAVQGRTSGWVLQGPRIRLRCRSPAVWARGRFLGGACRAAEQADDLLRLGGGSDVWVTRIADDLHSPAPRTNEGNQD